MRVLEKNLLLLIFKVLRWSSRSFWNTDNHLPDCTVQYNNTKHRQIKICIHLFILHDWKENIGTTKQSLLNTNLSCSSSSCLCLKFIAIRYNRHISMWVKYQKLSHFTYLQIYIYPTVILYNFSCRWFFTLFNVSEKEYIAWISTVDLHPDDAFILTTWKSSFIMQHFVNSLCNEVLVTLFYLSGNILQSDNFMWWQAGQCCLLLQFAMKLEFTHCSSMYYG